jgi:hypothetical protein
MKGTPNQFNLLPVRFFFDYKGRSSIVMLDSGWEVSINTYPPSATGKQVQFQNGAKKAETLRTGYCQEIQAIGGF